MKKVLLLLAVVFTMTSATPPPDPLKKVGAPTPESSATNQVSTNKHQKSVNAEQFGTMQQGNERFRSKAPQVGNKAPQARPNAPQQKSVNPKKPVQNGIQNRRIDEAVNGEAPLQGTPKRNLNSSAAVPIE